MGKKREKNYIWLTLLISILFGIILPLALGVKDLTYIAIFFSSVWVLYSIIFLGYVFLIEGRPYRNWLNPKKVWVIIVKRNKDPRMGNPDWN